MITKIIEWLVVEFPYPWFIKKRMWNLLPQFERWYGNPKNRIN